MFLLSYMWPSRISGWFIRDRAFQYIQFSFWLEDYPQIAMPIKKVSMIEFILLKDRAKVISVVVRVLGHLQNLTKFIFSIFDFMSLFINTL